ncbi:MAG: complex I NDUFA9 subunit family protein [Planctomycetes bacterium]|nr:complex I NDUFA9 subunit family protein [Planctomycetota bacterium]
MSRKKVLVTGATGYVGRHVVAAVANAGHDVRALLREGSNPRVIDEYVDDLHLGNVTDARSLEGACDGCDAVIHLVGVINEKEGSFEDIHVKGTRNILAEAERAGVRRFIYLSGLGTRANAVARYHQTKYAAEQSVRTASLQGYCFPASVIFGPEDEFLNLFVGMAKSWVNPPWPVMPAIAGGHSRLQPVWVEDVAEVLARSVAPDFPLQPGTYELGGPEPMTVREIMTVACKAAGKARIFVPVPLFVAQIMATFMEIFSSKPQLTRDQLIMVMEDGAAQHNMTSVILGRPARSLWDYACEQFDIPGPKPHRVVVGAGCYNDRVRPQTGILWTPPEKKEDKKEEKK